MNKSELLEKLSLVRPALTSKEFVPVFTCFCFTGKTLFAYNDLIAIETDLDWPVKGAVRGTTMLEMVKSLSDGQVDVTKDNDDLLIKSGRSKFKLPLLPEEEFIFEFPKKSSKQKFSLNEGRLQALKLAMLSSSNDPSHPERMGVTISDGHMFSTDGVVVTSVALGETTLSSTYILPYDFCRVLVEKGGDGGELTFHEKDGYVIASLKDCRIFSKLIQVEPVAYDDVFAEADWEGLKTIPDGLSGALERASIVMQGSSPKCIVEVKDGVLHLTSYSSNGQAEDSVAVPGHADVEADIHPSSVCRILDHVGSFQITKGHILLGGELNVHLIGNYL